MHNPVRLTWLMLHCVQMLFAVSASGQWQPNLRIEQGECGPRSLAWDAFPGASEGTVTYEVFRCDPSPGCNCPAYSASFFNEGNLCGWTPLGSTTSLQIVDLPNASGKYGIRCSLSTSLDFGVVNGIGRWAGPPTISGTASGLRGAPGQSLRLEVTLKTSSSATQFRWLRNGETVFIGTATSWNYLIQPSDFGAELAVEAITACGNATHTFGVISLPDFPQPTAGLQWVAFEKRDDLVDWGRRWEWQPNCCAAPRWCVHWSTNSTHFRYAPQSELGVSAFSWLVQASANGGSNCTGGGTCGSCNPYSYQSHDGTIEATALLSHHHVLELTGDGSRPLDWRMEVWLNGQLIYRPDPAGGAPLPLPPPVKLGVGPGLLRIHTRASLSLWEGSSQGYVSRPFAGELKAQIRVPEDVPSIQQAVEAAPQLSHFEIVVGPGVFIGPVDLAGKNITLRGAGRGLTTISLPPGRQSDTSVLQLSGEPASASIRNLTIKGGRSGSPISAGSSIMVGGGVYASNSAATFSDVDFEDNASDYGGGVYALNSTLRFERCTFQRNDAAQFGGGLLVFRGTATLNDCTVRDNSSVNRGGGMHVVGGSSHRLLRTGIVGNASDSQAGGLSWVPYGDVGASISLEECEVRTNTALVSQGGIGIEADSGNPSLTVQSTIACGNTPGPNIVGPFVDLGGNTLCGCPSDLNGDGVIDGSDLGLLLAAWGPCGTEACAADLDRNGAVDGADLGILLNDWAGCQ